MRANAEWMQERNIHLSRPWCARFHFEIQTRSRQLHLFVCSAALQLLASDACLATRSKSGHSSKSN
jgi:hypothetical protein